jgi:hypothetical protein
LSFVAPEMIFVVLGLVKFTKTSLAFFCGVGHNEFSRKVPVRKREPRIPRK